MRKLHDLKTLLSADTQLSRMDCMRIKGGDGGDGDADKRRDRDQNTSGYVSSGGSTYDTGGFSGG